VKSFVLTPTRLAWAVLVTGVAAWGVMWVLTYKILAPAGRTVRTALLILFPGVHGSASHVPANPNLWASPVWVIPVAAVIAISAVGADFLILRRR
jgi:hypothetical protein